MATLPTTRSPEARGLVAGLGLAAVLVMLSWRAEFALVHAWGFPLDDTWIHCTIARNLAQGQGWCYNPGVPVQNSSGPLWTALIALGYGVAGPGVWVPKILGALCFLGCVFMAWRLARSLSGDGWAAAGAALATALSGPLLWHGLSGMETPLAALLVAATVDSFVAYRAGWRRFAWVVFAALGTAARPEVLVLLPLLATFRLWEARRTAGRWREAGVAMGIGFAVLLPYFALNLTHSGSIFPSTFAAKAGETGVVNALGHGDLRELLVSLTLAPYVWTVHGIAFWGRTNVALLVAAVLGCIAVARGPRRTLAPALVLVLFPALRGAAAPHWNPIIQQGRYIGALMPLYFAVSAVGLAALMRQNAGNTGRRVLLAVLAGAVAASLGLELRLPHAGGGPLATLVALLPGVIPDPGLDIYLQWERFGLLVAVFVTTLLLALEWAPPRVLRGAGLALAASALLLQVTGASRIPRFYARNVRNIQDMDVTLGNWVRERVPAGTHVAVNDIGALAFFGQRPVVDAMGLATPELAPYLSPRRLRTLIGMRRLHPEVCVLFPSWFPEWIACPSLLTPLLRHTVTDNTILGASSAVVFRADWERFGRYYSDALLTKLDPPVVAQSLGAHWQRTQQNLGMPTRARLYRKAGDIWKQRGDLPAAEQAYRTATRLDSQETEAWTGLLQIEVSQRRATEYAATLAELVQRNPNSPDGYEGLGDYLISSGRTSEAAANYERALALRPDNLRLLGKLAGLWEKQGDAGRAASYRARLTDLQTSAGAP
jgi:hypothetical protein